MILKDQEIESQDESLSSLSEEEVLESRGNSTL